MNPYLSSSGLKAMARGQLIGRYGTVALAYFVQMLCIQPLSLAVTVLFGTNTLLNMLLYMIASFLISLLTGVFLVGEAYIYLKIACNQPVAFSDLLWGFRNENHKIIAMQAVIAAISVLTALPASVMACFNAMFPDNSALLGIYYILFIAGIIIDIIISLMLSQVYYLLVDFPDYTPSQLLQKSISLMKQNKWRLFRLKLSFLPLILLGYLSCGIGLLWVLPYKMATEANYYLDLIKKQKKV